MPPPAPVTSAVLPSSAAMVPSSCVVSELLLVDSDGIFRAREGRPPDGPLQLARNLGAMHDRMLALVHREDGRHGRHAKAVALADLRVDTHSHGRVSRP